MARLLPRTRKARVISSLAVCFAIAAPASAQSLPWGAAAGVGMERYGFADADAVGIESVSLLTVPLVAHAEPARWLLIDVNGSYARGELVRSDGSTSSIDGFTDTELRTTIPIRSGRTVVSLTAMAIVPTGLESQSAEEAAVAGVMAADLLPLRISNWGGGGGYAVNAAAARAFGGLNLGLSAGYRIASEFDPLAEGEFAFRPGNELRVRAAADRTVRGKSKASLHVTLFTYEDDRLDGANLYTSGDRLQLVGSYAFPVGHASSAVTYAGMLHRAQGSVINPLRTGALTTTADLPSQTLLLFGAGGRMPMGRHRLLPTADVRIFRREDGVGQGYVLGLGSSAELRLSGISSDFTAHSGRGLVLVPSFAFRFGRLIADEDAESNFTGIDLALAVRVGGGR